MSGLVDYSSGDESERSGAPSSAPRNAPKRPADPSEEDPSGSSAPKSARLPNAFAAAPESKPRVDAPSEHDGRVRSFAHVDGNWATFVYAKLSPASESALTRLRDAVVALAPNLRPSTDFHLSLTRTVVLKYGWIEGFTASARSAVRLIPSFPAKWGRLKVYVNEEKTRTFIGLRADSDGLDVLTDTLDGVLSEFGLPPFYEGRSFHVSLAWCLGDEGDAWRAKREELAALLEKKGGAFFKEDFQVESLVCKCGNKEVEMRLHA